MRKEKNQKPQIIDLFHSLLSLAGSLNILYAAVSPNILRNMEYLMTLNMDSGKIDHASPNSF
jgi:hypothetical protein